MKYYDLINELCWTAREAERHFEETLDFNTAYISISAIDDYIAEVIGCFVDGDVEQYMDEGIFTEEAYQNTFTEVSSKEKDIRLTHWVTNGVEMHSDVAGDDYVESICNQVKLLVELYIKTEVIAKNAMGSLV